MKTPNQNNLGEVIFRISKLIPRAIALAQGLAVILAATAATAQTRPVSTATNATVSTAEVTAFMQSFQQDPKAVFNISTNPKRVPLLLAAIERELAGPWVNFLQPVATDTNIIAVVLGKQISASETNELTGIILGSLMEQFATENSIEPTPEELDALIRRIDENGKQHQIRLQEERAKLIEELKNPSLSGSEREKKEARLKRLERSLKYVADSEKKSMENEEQARSMKRELALSFARPWKINQALYRKYGGRVVFQQAGLEPVEAYRDFLKEQEKKGNFKILNKTCAASFWGCFTNDSGHIFYSKEEGAKFMNTPWWMMEQAPEK